MLKKNILITGHPGVGKTTLIKRIAEVLKDLHPVGFYTEEIREKGERKGFELIGFDGRRGLLSHVNIKSPYRVSKYKVDVTGFEGFIDSIGFLSPEVRIVIIDEIGKMECLSERFRRMIKEILDSDRVVVATVAMKGGGFIEEIKEREDARIFEVKEGNRDSLPSEIIEYCRGLHASTGSA